MMTNNARDDHRILDSSDSSGSSAFGDSSRANGSSNASGTATGSGSATGNGSAAAAEFELVSQDFEERNLHELRQTVTAHAATVLADDRVADMALIAIELASNAIRHGGGRGRLRLWTTADAIHCQVTDDGPGFPDSKYPAVQRPEPSASGGRGLWLVLHFSDALTVDNDVDGGATVTAMITTGDRTPPRKP
jgi:anti-sigma regulatory factor (Ser/Thr protein kinase)